MTPPLIETRGLGKTYGVGGLAVNALIDVSVSVDHGTFLTIMGPSGSGKSTFMNLLGCLDRPSHGQYLLNGVDIDDLSSDQLAEFRRKTVGFVFQSFNLLPRLSATDNVALPLTYTETPKHERQDRAERLLAQVGLGARGHHKPTELSGGQKQRVAIARALVNDPKLILADEPTGALDTRTGLEVMALLQKLNREGRTIVVVTHDPEVAAFATRVIRFRDGRVVDDKINDTPIDAAARLALLPDPHAAATVAETQGEAA